MHCAPRSSAPRQRDDHTRMPPKYRTATSRTDTRPTDRRPEHRPPSGRTHIQNESSLLSSTSSSAGWDASGGSVVVSARAVVGDVGSGGGFAEEPVFRVRA